ncbi:hypothetical protein PAXRUDRAFT_830964 [Paxillus rubicundulus Ve08.2h10]|uniref:Uncharacterized protein n=1 Tax=Paxillus rubicundulus Ve08.2h10 TaxID=930991 RepID=A0A0D0DSS6_9AGAM|nr:hypothetical protein PAXRUDRAFT_830964 [Paxillus rubicundulus Ve08.2h10]
MRTCSAKWTSADDFTIPGQRSQPFPECCKLESEFEDRFRTLDKTFEGLRNHELPGAKYLQVTAVKLIDRCGSQDHGRLKRSTPMITRIWALSAHVRNVGSHLETKKAEFSQIPPS